MMFLVTLGLTSMDLYTDLLVYQTFSAYRLDVLGAQLIDCQYKVPFEVGKPRGGDFMIHTNTCPQFPSTELFFFRVFECPSESSICSPISNVSKILGSSVENNKCGGRSLSCGDLSSNTSSAVGDEKMINCVDLYGKKLMMGSYWSSSGEKFMMKFCKYPTACSSDEPLDTSLLQIHSMLLPMVVIIGLSVVLSLVKLIVDLMVLTQQEVKDIRSIQAFRVDVVTVYLENVPQAYFMWYITSLMTKFEEASCSGNVFFYQDESEIFTLEFSMAIAVSAVLFKFVKHVVQKRWTSDWAVAWPLLGAVGMQVGILAGLLVKKDGRDPGKVMIGISAPSLVLGLLLGVIAGCRARLARSRAAERRQDVELVRCTKARDRECGSAGEGDSKSPSFMRGSASTG